MTTTVRINRRRFMAASAATAASLVLAGRLPLVVGAAGEARFAYVGTYTKNPPGGGGTLTPVGISVFRVADGVLTLIQTVPSANPSFLAIDQTQRFLFAITRVAS